MDTAQAVEEISGPKEVAKPEKVSGARKVKILMTCLLVLGWLMVMADGAGIFMVAFSYHENLGVAMVVGGLFGGVLFISAAIFIAKKLRGTQSVPSDS